MTSSFVSIITMLNSLVLKVATFPCCRDSPRLK
ncbi:hypothetical protein F383_10974 [Gossypium arboreum]|uniref:Uncharacterized protein n=1 Tax=Gossypium arboreum TaxID=29729 RepID=A0A0B0ME93_GOSAR|nr:hypothetical protein F383_10974 [Gossypium arboreum]